MQTRDSRITPEDRVVCPTDICRPEREMTDDASENSSQLLCDADGARVQLFEERESIKFLECIQGYIRRRKQKKTILYNRGLERPAALMIQCRGLRTDVAPRHKCEPTH